VDDATPASPRIEERYDPDKEVAAKKPEPWPPLVSVLEESVSLAMLLCGSNVILNRFSAVTERAHLRSVGLFAMLFDAVYGSIMLFGGWSMSTLSEGFPPGPPKKPPPWFPYIKILVIFGTSNLWLY
jgi:hypothetical protein